MVKVDDLFFELIQVALGKRERLSHNPSAGEWDSLYAETIKQSVAGVAFEGVQKLPKEQWPPQPLLFKWIGVCEQIKNQNLVANKRSAEATKMFAEAGYQSCILKGQGNALIYPNPYSRMSGDIDIWITGHKGNTQELKDSRIKNANSTDETNKVLRDEINEFVKARCPKAFEQEHHIEFPIFKDIEVEVHYSPGTLLSPKCNRRFQKWCHEQKDDKRSVKYDNENYIFVPSIQFNVVYQMAHIMIHFFIEGIGLRHFIDYYYVLRKFQTESIDCAKIQNWFKEFGLLKFARGVMWVEKICLGLEDAFLLVEPDERLGHVILKEMLEGGNFGHYDERYKSRKNGYLARGMTDGYRLLKLAMVFPSESMWKMYRKIGNQRWKLKTCRV